MTNHVVFALIFYVLAALVLLSGMAVVLLRNVVHAAVALIACFFFVAWIYLLLNADLLWVAQLLIYAGAIPVLIVFAIMFTRRSMSDTSSAGRPHTRSRAPWLPQASSACCWLSSSRPSGTRANGRAWWAPPRLSARSWSTSTRSRSSWFRCCCWQR